MKLKKCRNQSIFLSIDNQCQNENKLNKTAIESRNPIKTWNLSAYIYQKSIAPTYEIQLCKRAQQLKPKRGMKSRIPLSTYLSMEKLHCSK